MEFKQVNELPKKPLKSSKWEPMVQEFLKSGFKYAEVMTGNLDTYDLGKINGQISMCAKKHGVKCRRINNKLYLVRED